MFDYSMMDNAMREGANQERPFYVGKNVSAEVCAGGDSYATKTVEGVCVDVYADISTFDAVVYKIKENETGNLYASPAFYRRTWHYPELKHWSIENFGRSSKPVLCGLLFDNDGSHHCVIDEIRSQHTVDGGISITLKNGESYFCRKTA